MSDIETTTDDTENPQVTDAVTQASPVPQSRPLIKNHTELGPMFKIVLTNFALTIVTLGIYRFWGKTRLRQYLWGHVEIMGDRLEYTGTGKELFFGFLFVFIVILLPFFLFISFIDVVYADNEVVRVTVSSVQTIVIIFLVGAAWYRARRYRLTRTHWRGIYGNQSGSAVHYGLIAIGCYFLVGLTAGLIWPVCSVWLRSYEMNHTWIGDQQPEFQPQVSALYGPFLKAWFLGALSIGGLFLLLFGMMFILPLFASVLAPIGYVGIILTVVGWFFWYRGKAYDHFVSSTRFINHDVTSAITGGGFMRLSVGNFLILLFSLGLASPFVYRRYLNYVENRVGLSGDGDFSDLLQSEIGKPTRGEGLADAFDVGAI
ncbi:YjgN family protein [Magnetovibrio sp. PR-2]|uniref:YjgN family protein n=1 Tax=Magnetovibrio sp. PR-2 TaxID=3120356 RepID=UPI002FCE3F3D